MTGGAGFIGSNLVDALLERGDEVMVLDDLSTGRRENLDAALEGGRGAGRGDIRDAERLAALAPSERPEPSSTWRPRSTCASLAEPAFDAEINVVGTVNMLEAARAAERAPLRVRLHRRRDLRRGRGSSCRSTRAPPIEPRLPYGQASSRPRATAIYRPPARALAVGLRFGNVYGPRQDPLGEAG